MVDSQPPRRRKNKELRGREHLTADEVERLAIAAGRVGRFGHRDAWMLRVAFRHGLRVGELVTLRRDQCDLKKGFLHVKRAKGSLPSTHDMSGPELRALRQLIREAPESPYLFVSHFGGPLCTAAVRKIVTRAAEEAGIKIKVHPHMFRHSCGFALANAGRDTRAIQAWLGHAAIQNTVIYTNLAEGRLKGLFPD